MPRGIQQLIPALLGVGTCLLGLPATGRANGGPVSMTLPTARGDVAPIEESRVRLVSERLRINLDEDGDRYAVEAQYTLSNASGAPVAVTYGVPLTWDELYPEEAKRAESYPADVVVELEGRRSRCRFGEVRRQKELGYGYVRSAAWCVADLVVPPGDGHLLSLRYPGVLLHGDDGVSTSPFTFFSSRALEYDLAPAGGWAGPTESLSVVLEAGPWADHIEALEPKGWRRLGSRFELRRPGPDLSALGTLSFTVSSQLVLARRQRLASASKPARATASSALAPQGRYRYDAANAVDGDLSTAWCAGRRRAAVGEWIEISASLPECESFSGPWGLVIPGYSKDPAVWRSNNRVRGVRVGPCGQAPGQMVSRATSLELDEAFIDVSWLNHVVPPGERGGGVLCLRVTVAEVEPGPAGDTCLSEVRVVCRR